MRSKDGALMEQIHSYIDEYYLREEETPSTTDIAREFSISRSSAYRYLMAMAEKKLIGYADGIIQTALMMKCRTGHNPTPVVGSVICGDPAQEQECIEEYVSLPESIFGKGDFFILRARGDSMADAGIDEDDLLVIERNCPALVGDIVVALDEDNQNTLKRYAGYDEDSGYYILEYENEARYPGKTIKVRSFQVQGVARHVIKSL